MHVNEWNNNTDNQHIALKAAIVLLAACLQKPSIKSKAKDHQNILAKRLALWKDGEIAKLIREGKIIQSRIRKRNQFTSPQDKSKVFAKLVMEGQINSALCFLNESTDGGVLPLTDDVMKQLLEKHPAPQPAKLGSLLFGPIDDNADCVTSIPLPRLRAMHSWDTPTVTNREKLIYHKRGRSSLFKSWKTKNSLSLVFFRMSLSVF